MTLASLLLVSVLVTSIPLARANDPTVTITKHVDLGMQGSVPISVPPSSQCEIYIGDPIDVCVYSTDIGFTGTATYFASLGVDISMTYDPAALVPGGSLPVTLTYTPTPGGSSVYFDVSGTANVVSFTGCDNCPVNLPVTLVHTSPTTFTAPLTGDSSTTITGSSSTITLNINAFGTTLLDVLNINLATSLTISPSTCTSPCIAGVGLSGGAAGMTVTGASGAPVLPLEWDTSGQSLTTTLTLPSNLVGIGVTLGPLLQWVSTSGSAQVNLAWTSDLQTAWGVAADILSLGVCAIPGVNCSLPNPSPITLFSGGLGPLYQQLGLDTAIGNIVGGTAGPLVAGQVAAGNVPVPLTSPPLATIPPIPSTLGSITFSIPVTSISGAPPSAVLLGDSVTLSAITAGGTGPFSYAWTKNGAPFGGSTASITDTPSIGTTTYGVTVTDSLGAVSNTPTVAVNVYDFSLGVAPSSLTVLTTGSNTYSPGVTESLDAGSTTLGLPSIGLSLTGGLPAGATPTFTPSGGSASGFTSALTITTSGAPAGTYTLTVTGTDSTSGYGGTRSTTAALTIQTPAQALPSIINLITTFHLNRGQMNSLITKLNMAIGNLNLRPPNTSTACNQLNAFVNEVNSFVAEGLLTTAQANQLLNPPLGVLAIMAAIPCS